MTVGLIVVWGMDFSNEPVPHGIFNFLADEKLEGLLHEAAVTTGFKLTTRDPLTQGWLKARDVGGRQLPRLAMARIACPKGKKNHIPTYTPFFDEFNKLWLQRRDAPAQT